MIIGEPITLTVSEHEADIIQAALSRYDGPYAPGSALTGPEVVRQNTMIAEAQALCQQVQDELMRRYEADETRMFSKAGIKHRATLERELH